MVSEYAHWRSEQGGDLLDQGAVAELMRAGDGRTILERIWEADPAQIQFPGAAERTRRLLDLAADLPSVGVLEGRLLEGWIDHLSPQAVAGWIWAPGIPDLRIPLRVYRNGSPVASLTARKFRPDLVAAGKGDGRYAFFFPFESPLGATDAVSVRLGSTRCEIEVNPQLARDRQRNAGA